MVILAARTERASATRTQAEMAAGRSGETEHASSTKLLRGTTHTPSAVHEYPGTHSRDVVIGAIQIFFLVEVRSGSLRLLLLADTYSVFFTLRRTVP